MKRKNSIMTRKHIVIHMLWVTYLVWVLSLKVSSLEWTFYVILLKDYLNAHTGFYDKKVEDEDKWLIL